MTSLRIVSSAVFACVLLTSALLVQAASAEVQLASIFSDDMVLQRAVSCPIWGTATPGSEVEVLVNGKPVVSGRAGDDGAFQLRLPVLREPGPYEIEVRSGSETQTLSNVLVGEVWICSGQSNMEWPVHQASNPEQEIAQADHPNIRLYHVPHAASDQPATSIDARWVICSPETIPQFSAVAYYFGRHLNGALDVPVGLIASAWGGTPAESWTPLRTLKELSDLPLVSKSAANVDMSRQPDATEQFEAAMLQWMTEANRLDAGVSDEAKDWAALDLETADWRPMKMPTDVTKHGVPGGSVTWYRRAIDVPAERAGQELILTLGIIDDFDTTYFNGERIGVTDHRSPSWWNAHRRYVVPGELVTPGRNVIAVRNVDLDGAAGLTGPAGAMRATIGSHVIPLTGEWWHRVERESQASEGPQPTRPLPPYKLDSAWTPGTLYNGMIHPLGPFAIRGAIWYQGESNAARHQEYAPLLTAMIDSWRKQFGVGDFPFYIVGLANFRALTDDPNQISHWASLREAQRQVAHNLDNSAVTVTLDIGEEKDIHPRNKQEVGRRLALVALEETYGRHLVSRGPTLKSASFEDGEVVLTFDHIGSGLVAQGNKLTSFTVAGEDGQFVWADARIEGDTVVVSSPEVPTPKQVRYAWADNPKASLFNEEGLPAEPFEARR